MEVVRWDRGKPASAVCLYARNELEEADDDEKHSCGLLQGKARVTPSPKIQRDLTIIKSSTAGLRQAMNAKAGLEKKLIRREVVSHIYKIFDSLGLLAPTTIKFKMLLQKWTKAGLEWNEPLEAS